MRGPQGQIIMPIDIIFIAVFAYGFWQGYNQGIIETLFNLGSYIFGFIIAFKMTPVTTNLLERMFNTDNPSLFLAAFAVNLVIVTLILRAAASGIERLFEAAYMGLLNRLLGGLVLGTFGIMVYSVLIWFLVKVEFLNEATLTQSGTYPVLKEIPPRARAVAVRIKPLAIDVWDTSINWIDRLEKYGIDKTESKQKIYEVPEDRKIIEDEPESSRSRPQAAAPSADDDGLE